MEIVTSGGRRRAVVRSGLAAANARENQAKLELAVKIANRAADAALKRVMADARNPKSKSALASKYGPGSGAMVPNGGGGRKGGGGGGFGDYGGSGSGSNTGIIIGQSPRMPPMRIRAEGIIKLTNTAANICDTYLRVALDDGLGATTGTLAAYCPRLTSYKGLFRRYQLKGLLLQWVPSVADTVDGAVAVAYDTDIRLGNLSTVSNVLLRPIHFMTPMRMAGGRLTFRPTSQVDKEERYCATATSGGTTRAVEETQYGSVAIVAENALANGATIGYLRIVMDVQFSDQI